MSNACTVPLPKPPVYGGYWFKIPIIMSIDSVESFLKEATKKIGMDMGLWEKLSDANWGNNELEYRLEDGKCRPTLKSLLAARYLHVPEGWPKTNLITDVDTGTGRSARLDLSDRRGIRFDPSLNQSGGLEPQPDEGKDEESSPLVWVAGLGAVGVLAYLFLKK
jgi:hypothetical protein